MTTILKVTGLSKPVVRIPIFLLKPLAHILDIFFHTPPLTPAQLDNLSEDRDYNIGDIVKLFHYTPTSLENGLKRLIAQDF